MSETCDVDGCAKAPVADLLDASDGLRCRDCLLYDLDNQRRQQA